MEVIFEVIRTLIAPALQVLLALTGAYLVTLWVVLIIWTFRDIETRSRSVITQVFATLLVVFFFLPGVLLYLILRPRETLDEAFQRSLQEEYLLQDLEELPLCPTCRRYVQSDFVLCPHCYTRLRENCPSCERLVELRWSVCPYCTMPLPAADETEVETEDKVGAPVHLPEWVSPAMQQLRERVLELRARLGDGGSVTRPRLGDGTAARTLSERLALRNGYRDRDTPLPPDEAGRRRESRSDLAPRDEAATETAGEPTPAAGSTASESSTPEATAGSGRLPRE